MNRVDELVRLILALDAGVDDLDWETCVRKRIARLQSRGLTLEDIAIAHVAISSEERREREIDPQALERLRHFAQRERVH